MTRSAVTICQSKAAKAARFTWYVLFLSFSKGHFFEPSNDHNYTHWITFSIKLLLLWLFQTKNLFSFFFTIISLTKDSSACYDRFISDLVFINISCNVTTKSHHFSKVFTSDEKHQQLKKISCRNSTHYTFLFDILTPAT